MSSAETKPATHCGSCAAPLPRPPPGLGLPANYFLTFQDAETKDLCARCTWIYYHKTGVFGHGGRMSTGIPNPNSPFPFVRAAATAVGEKKKKVAAAAPEKKNVAPGSCAACRKKVGLLGFACRCGGAFCAAHRHAESHGCGFDYKEFGRKRITRENPVVVAPKVAKILTATGK